MKRQITIVMLTFILFFINTAESSIVKVDKSSKTPYDYVNPFIGTGGDGHTFPGAAVPFGMVQLSPDTDIKNYKKSYNWCAGYRYSDKSILGFSHTHFSGTGHSDLGDILIMPIIGILKTQSGTKDNPDTGYRSRFSHKHENASPGYYSVLLKDYNILAELTATNRVGFHKYTFPRSNSSYFIIDLLHNIYNYDGKVIWAKLWVKNNRIISGFRQTRGWARTRYLFFVIEFSKPFDSFGFVKGDKTTYGYKKSNDYIIERPEISGKKLKAFVNYKTEKDEIIYIKVGISSVSTDGALNNLRTEIPHWDFNKVRKMARTLWEKELNKIIIKGTKKEKEIFYTSLYHTALSPITYMDVDRRYRGLDQNIHVANNFINYTIFSLWDTFRATHPLFTIIQRDKVSDMIKSMMAHYDQSPYHMLPIWSFHNNETWCMIGYHAVSVIADAYLKGIREYDIQKAYEAMKATATRRDYDGLDHYMDKGYVAIDKEDEAASKTLEYAYDDWTIAQMAKSLGFEQDYITFMKRAANYKNIFDQKTNFMRAKKSNKTWNEPFDPLYSKYGGDYTEGNAWQYTWYVPHDVKGLISLMGGRNKFVKKLDKLFSIKTTDKKYHEVEDISGLIGQYAHGNEPSQHIAYLYNYAGMPWKTQKRIHQIMRNLFNNTPDGICGNEDCGQMSSWYIFSSMGFYPVCPGSNIYVIGSPCIKKATICLKNNKRFVINAKNLSEKNIYIQSVTLNDKKINKSYILHQNLIQGGNLTFIMGSKPNKKWGTKKSSIPPSMTK